ncbi:hypothetical protein PAPYR_1096 [Paratrimastix pyriformis]|uniref:Protein kinase domain-containing protein n=1 Tax=Paratrimastix pyriformis TaxID=342808 RepID=A0ABQ8UYJ1_9EUKA|nr:hypothetical protein PAPYR_1096 [Paratrimastix pyriformis]
MARLLWSIFIVIVSILLPPLAAFLLVGCTTHFFLNIVLTILGWIPLVPACHIAKHAVTHCEKKNQLAFGSRVRLYSHISQCRKSGSPSKYALFLLGGGFFGATHSAEVPPLVMPCCIHTFTYPFSNGKDCDTFQRELAVMTSKLHHPHIVAPVGGFFSGGHQAVVIRPQLPENLRDVLRRRAQKGEPVLLERVVGLASDIVRGLVYLNQKGLVHGDLHPGNILLDQDGRARLCDFGHAHIRLHAIQHFRSLVGGESPGGAGMEQLYPHLAPETYVDTSSSPKGDCWALGLVLVELVTLSPPRMPPTPVGITSPSTPRPPGLGAPPRAAAGGAVGWSELVSEPGEMATVHSLARQYKQAAQKHQGGVEPVLSSAEGHLARLLALRRDALQALAQAAPARGFPASGGAALVQLAARCMALNPQMRPSPPELLTALQRLLAPAPAPAPAPGTPGGPTTPRPGFLLPHLATSPPPQSPASSPSPLRPASSAHRRSAGPPPPQPPAGSPSGPSGLFPSPSSPPWGTPGPSSPPSLPPIFQQAPQPAPARSAHAPAPWPPASSSSGPWLPPIASAPALPSPGPAPLQAVLASSPPSPPEWPSLPRVPSLPPSPRAPGAAYHQAPTTSPPPRGAPGPETSPLATPAPSLHAHRHHGQQGPPAPAQAASPPAPARAERPAPLLLPPASWPPHSAPGGGPTPPQSPCATPRPSPRTPPPPQLAAAAAPGPFAPAPPSVLSALPPAQLRLLLPARAPAVAPPQPAPPPSRVGNLLWPGGLPAPLFEASLPAKVGPCPLWGGAMPGDTATTRKCRAQSRPDRPQIPPDRPCRALHRRHCALIATTIPLPPWQALSSYGPRTDARSELPVMEGDIITLIRVPEGAAAPGLATAAGKGDEWLFGTNGTGRAGYFPRRIVEIIGDPSGRPGPPVHQLPAEGSAVLEERASGRRLDEALWISAAQTAAAQGPTPALARLGELAAFLELYVRQDAAWLQQGPPTHPLVGALAAILRAHRADPQAADRCCDCLRILGGLTGFVGLTNENELDRWRGMGGGMGAGRGQPAGDGGRGPEDVGLAGELSKALALLAMDGLTEASLGLAGAVPILLDALARYGQTGLLAAVVEQVLACLVNVTSLEVHCVGAVKGGLVPRLVSVLQAHPGHGMVARHACHLACNLAAHESTRGALADPVALNGLLLWALQLHQGQPLLVEAVCRVLDALLRAPETAPKVLAVDGWTGSLTKALAHHTEAQRGPLGAPLVERIVAAMAALCLPSGSQRSEFHAANGLSILEGLLGPALAWPAVLTQGFLLLRVTHQPEWVAPAPDGPAHCPALAPSAALLDVLLAALRQHANTAALLEQAFGLLAMVDLPCRPGVVTQVVPLVLVTLRGGSLSASLAELSCLPTAENVLDVLGLCSRVPEGRGLVAADGAVLQTLFELFYAHAAAPEVIDKGWVAICGLLDDDRLRAAFSQPQVLAVLLQTLGTHLGVAAIVEILGMVLGRLLAAGQQSAFPSPPALLGSLLGDPPSLAMLQEALALHRDQSRTVQSLLGVLGPMADAAPAGPQALLQAGMVPALLEALRPHLASRAIVTQGAAIMCALVATPLAAEALATSGAPAVVLELMGAVLRAHPAEWPLPQQAATLEQTLAALAALAAIRPLCCLTPCPAMLAALLSALLRAASSSRPSTDNVPSHCLAAAATAPLGAEEGLALAMEACRRFGEHPGVVAQALAACHYLAARLDGPTGLLSTRAVPQLLDTLGALLAQARTAPLDAASPSQAGSPGAQLALVCAQACQTVATATASAHLQRAALLAGGADLLAGAIADFPQRALVAEHALAALSALTQHPKALGLVDAGRIIPALAQALRAHATLEPICGPALAVLGRLLPPHLRGLDPALALGDTLEAVLEALHQHGPRVRRLAEAAMDTVRPLCVAAGPAGAAHRELFIQRGGLTLLAELLRQHGAQAPALARHCFHVVAVVVRTPQGRAHARALASRGELALGPLLVGLVRAGGPADVRLAEHGLYLLEALALEGFLGPAELDELPRLCVDLLAAHPGQAPLGGQAMRLLGALAERHGGALQAMVTAGAAACPPGGLVGLTLGLLRAHMQVSALVEAACGLLAAMAMAASNDASCDDARGAGTDELEAAIGAAGGLAVVMEAVRCFASHRTGAALLMGYKALAGLSFNEDNKAALLAAGGVPQCVETLQWIVTGSGAALGGPAAAGAGAPPSVAAVMVEALAAQAAACLLNLVAYPRARPLVVAAGGVPVVAGLLQRSGHASARVMERACQAMSFLCLEREAMDLLAAAGAPRLVVEALRAQPAAEGLVQQAALALTYFAASPAHRRNLVALGAPGALHEALRQHGARHQGATLRALGALGLLLPEGSDCRAAFGAAGGVTLLFELLRRHHDDPALVRLGLAALRAALQGAPDRCALGQVAAGFNVANGLLQEWGLAPGAPQAAVAEDALALMGRAIRSDEPLPPLASPVTGPVVGALREHMAAPGAVQEALAILGAITGTEGGALEVVQADGAAAVVAAMRQHGPQSAALAEQGCLVLRNLSAWDATEGALHPAGALGALLDCLRTHGSSGALAEQGAAALRNITAPVRPPPAHVPTCPTARATTANPLIVAPRHPRGRAGERQLGAIRAGAVAVLVDLLRRHPERGPLAEQALGALRNLAASGEGQAAVAGAEGVPLILGALRTHAADPAVTALGCALLYSLAATPDNEAALTRGRAAEEALGALCTHSGNPAVVQQAAAALRVLCSNERTRDAVGECALPGLVGALRTHVAQPAVLEAVAFALAALALAHENCTALVSGGGVAALRGALEAQRESCEPVEAITAVILNLAARERLRDGLHEGGVAGALLEALRPHLAERPSLVRQACHALAHLGLHPGARGEILARDGVGLLCEGLRVHMVDGALVEQALMALVPLACARGTAEAFLRRGAVPLLVHALRTHPAAPVAEAATAVLMHILPDGSHCRGPLPLAGPTAHMPPLCLGVTGAHSSPALPPLVLSSAPGALPHPFSCPLPPGPGGVGLRVRGCRGGADACRRTFQSADGLAGLLEAMQRHPASAGLQDRACVILKLLARAPGGAAEVGAAGQLTGLLGRFVGSPALARAILVVLLDMAPAEEVRGAMVAAGGVPLLVEIVRGQQPRPELVEAALGCLANIAASPACKGTVTQAQGDLAAAGALGPELLSRQPLVLYACATIGSLALARLVGRCRYIERPPLVEAACGALLNVLSGHPSCRTCCGATDQPPIAALACRIVHNLATIGLSMPQMPPDNGPCAPDVPRGPRLCGRGRSRCCWMPAAVPRHADLLGFALGALSCLTGSQGHKVAVGKAGGVDLLLGCLTRHRRNPALLVARGAPELLVELIRAHPAAPAVLQQAAAALTPFALIDSVRTALGAAGAVGELLGVAARYMEAPAVLCPAGLALENLTVSPANGAEALGQGGLRLGLRIVRAHLGAPEVVVFATGILRNLAPIEGSLEQMVAEGGPALCVEAFRRHAGDLEIVEDLCFLMRCLALAAPAQRRFLKAAGLEGLQAAFLSFGGIIWKKQPL